MSRLDTKFLLFDLTGPNGRRLDRKIQFNKTGDLVSSYKNDTFYCAMNFYFLIYYNNMLPLFQYTDFNMVEIDRERSIPLESYCKRT